MNKTVFVKSHFKGIYKNVEIETPTGEIKTGFLGIKKEIMKKETIKKLTGYSDCEIDGKRLSDDIENAVNELNKDGFDVIGITEITSGSYNYAYKSMKITSSTRLTVDTEAISGNGGYGYGYGYSYTEGVLILAHRLT